jgi:hypothetical protein
MAPTRLEVPPDTLAKLRLACLDLPRFRRAPFFRPLWFPNIAGLFIEANTDWDDVTPLVVDSYCVLAPKKLVARVDRG